MYEAERVPEGYKGCENCKYTDCSEFAEPCNSCKNTFVNGTADYESHKLLWESPNCNPVIHPSHYNQGNIECIDAMVAAFGKEAVATWCKLNAFKYIWREQHKGGIQDINKAAWYIDKYKELHEDKECGFLD